MKVLLLKDIKKIGQKGTVVEVADGYATSYLIPRGLAKKGTANQEKQAVVKQEQHAKKIEQREQEHEDLFKKFNKKKVTFDGVNVNQSGKLFSAITAADISAQLPGLPNSTLQMKHGIKDLGEHQIPFKVANNTGHITVHINR